MGLFAIVVYHFRLPTPAIPSYAGERNLYSSAFLTKWTKNPGTATRQRKDKAPRP